MRNPGWPSRAASSSAEIRASGSLMGTSMLAEPLSAVLRELVHEFPGERLRALCSQAGAEPQGILAQDLPLGPLAELGTVHHLVETLRPRRVAVRPVGGEQPQVVAQLLHAEGQ